MQGSFHQVVKISDEARQLMLCHAIAPTPTNYSVIYWYFSKENLALTQKIDLQLATCDPLDAYFLNEVYTEFLSNTQQIEKNLLTPFEQTLSGTLAQLDNQVSSEEEALSNLAKIGQALTRLGEYKPLQSIITFLLNAVDQSKDQHKSLSNELYKACQEVTQLKDKLEKSRQEALVDTLTGLLNRRGCELKLQRLSLNDMHSSLVIDIDHFKKVNDSFGHSIGDKVIQLVADVIKENVTDADIPVRYGGEEFVVVFSNKSQKFAHTIAEKIRIAISKLKLVQRQTNTILPPITVSIGIAQLQKNMAWSTLFNNADEALYQAKGSGRNRCVLSSKHIGSTLERSY
ncbi:MAG: GGDEF domain-containing protein [Colwellia sp.]|nr:GGDEF domain-containing protein [Colwellia sp.]